MSKLLPLSLLISCLIAGCASPTSSLPTATQLTPVKDAVWFKLPTEAYRGKQDDVFFLDAQLGFYVNGIGKIYRSQDGGLNWKMVLNQPGTYFRAIGMIDARHGFAGNIGTDYFPGVTDETPLYETNDGGETWQAVKNLPGTAVKGICAIDIVQSQFINAGYLDERTIVHAGGRVGSPAQLLRSLDGGRNWVNIDMRPWVASIVDVKFFDAMNGVVFAGSDPDIAKSHALIVVTHDGGKTWDKAYESPRAFEMTWKGSFPTREVGYATVQNYNPDKEENQRRILKTRDGGKTWLEMDLVKDAAVREFGIGFANENLGWVGTTTGGFETRDGGTTWNRLDLGRYVNKIRILPDGQGHFTAFAIGADVFKFAVPPANLPVPTPTVPATVGKP